MARMMLSDAQWNIIDAILPKSKIKGSPGRPRLNDRLVIEGILWIHRTGAPWRDLPPDFGPWPTVYSRFRRWSAKGVWDLVWSALKKMNKTTSRI